MNVLALKETSPATDGAHVILAMLIVGLIFLVVIALGELARSAAHRRQARRPRPY